MACLGTARAHIVQANDLAERLGGQTLVAVAAWIGAIAVFTLGHLTMEGVMEFHVQMTCAVRHVAAWDRVGNAESRK